MEGEEGGSWMGKRGRALKETAKGKIAVSFDHEG